MDSLSFIPSSEEAEIERHFLGGNENLDKKSSKSSDSKSNSSNFDLHHLMSYYSKNAPVIGEKYKDKSDSAAVDSSNSKPHSSGGLCGLGFARKEREKNSKNNNLNGSNNTNGGESGNLALGALQKKLKRMQRRQQDLGSEIYQDNVNNVDFQVNGDINKDSDQCGENLRESELDGNAGSAKASETTPALSKKRPANSLEDIMMQRKAQNENGQCGQKKKKRRRGKNKNGTSSNTADG